MRPYRRKFTVELVCPPNANTNDCKEYILDAVMAWRGSLHPPFANGDDDPGDPMFNLDPGYVRVKAQRKKKP